MKEKSSIWKLFSFVLGMTVVSFGLSYSFSVLANESAFPLSLLTKVKHDIQGEAVVVNESMNFDPSGIEDLTIETGSTDIKVINHHNAEIKVILEGEIRGYEVAKSLLEVNKSANGIGLRVDEDGKFKEKKEALFKARSNDLKLEIYLPLSNKMSVKISTGSGDVENQSISAREIMVKTGSGDVRNSDVVAAKLKVSVGSGDVSLLSSRIKVVKVATGSGDVTLHESKVADAKVETASGDVSLGEVENAAKVSTASGDVTLKMKSTKPNVKVDTASGDVTLGIDTLASFDLELNTGSGELSGDIVVPISEVNKRSFKLIVGEASERGRVALNTSSGDISIKK